MHPIPFSQKRGTPLQKKMPGEQRKARSSWLSWLFHAFLPLKNLEKLGKARKFLAFLESLEWYSKNSLGEPGGNSWLSRKAWNLTTVGRARKPKKTRNYQKLPGFPQRGWSITDCCIAKNTQEHQE